MAGATEATILIVDDDPQSLFALEAILEAPGRRILKAWSGDEALRTLLREPPPALILLDVVMPELDGLELAQLIRSRERCRNVPIIFLTAVSKDPLDVRRAYEIGAVDYLVKPVDPDLVRAKVSSFVELYQSGVEARRRSAALLEEEQRLQQSAVAELRRSSDRDQRRMVEERAQLLSREQLALAQAEAALRRFELLADASSALAGSLEGPPSLSSVARLAVDRGLCGWCAAFVAEEGRLGRPLAFAHRDAHREALGATLQLGESAARAHGAEEVMKSGQPEAASECGPDRLASALGLSHPEQLAELEVSGYVMVPLLARRQVLGLLLFVSTEAAHRHELADLALMLDLGRRAALAFDNAQLYLRAQEAIRAREEFLSIASHELRTPVSALQLSLQSALRTSRREGTAQSNEQMVGKVGAAQRQVARLTKLIEELLDVSRVSSGPLSLELEEVDGAALAREVVGRMEAELESAGCTLELHAEPCPLLLMDRLRMERALTNLLGNAIKYGAGKPIELRAEAHRGGLRLRVRDHGIGIPQADLPRIFGRFERAVRARSYGGLGLGLYIVEQIIKAHGGQIGVESRLGEGSTFTIELPRIEQQDARPASPAVALI